MNATNHSSVLTKKQSKKFGAKLFVEKGANYKIIAIVRYDDSCGNGHNTFSITGEMYRQHKDGVWHEDSFGCIHNAIAEHFPELAPLIKWHLCSSDGPLHYIANTVYHASDRDHFGLKKGEFAPGRAGIGKERNFAYARSCAIWPEATDGQLSLPEDELKALLEARLPALMDEFKAAVESLGFVY